MLRVDQQDLLRHLEFNTIGALRDIGSGLEPIPAGYISWGSKDDIYGNHKVARSPQGRVIRFTGISEQTPVVGSVYWNEYRYISGDGYYLRPMSQEVRWYIRY